MLGVLGGCSLLLSVLFLFLLYLIYTVVNMAYVRSLYNGIPSPPLDNFWYGHQVTMVAAKKDNTFLDVFGAWTKEYGSSIMVFASFRNILFTVDPNMFKVVTSDLNSFSKLDDLPNRSLFGQRIAGWNSVLTGGGHNWAIKRKVMSKFFAKANTSETFELCKPLIQNYVRSNLAGKVGKGQVIELHNEFSTIFSAYPAAVGLSGFDDPDTIGRNVSKILEMIPKQLGGKFSLTKLLFAVGKDKSETVDMVIEMRKRLKALTREKMQEIHSSDSAANHSDLLGLLIQANESCDFERDLLDEYVVDDILTIYLVMDNMVKQLASLFIFLESEQEVYRKMAREIRDFTLTDSSSLSQLRYTEQVLLESLRMAPALLRGTRLLKTPDETPSRIGPYNLASGTQIHFSQYLIHHNEQTWRDPKKFDPERWSNGFQPEPYTYMPFLAGPRGCLGKHFAMMTMKLTLVSILQKFELIPKLNKEKRPTIDQGMAVMRIRNNVDYELIPLPHPA
ncbi:hypothetical protein ACHWQZ_G002847 [Mnemiopsis leidyi]